MQTLIARSVFLFTMFTLQDSAQCFGEPHVVSPKFGKHQEIQRGIEAATRSGDENEESSSRTPKVEALAIVGGESATIGMNPWQAAIIRRNDPKGRPFCGGSVIGKRHILTAAHCVFDTEEYFRFRWFICKRQVRRKPRQLIVRLGAFDWTDQEETTARNYRVKKIVHHEGYNIEEKIGDDIALLVLDEDVVFGNYINEIPLSPPEEEYNGSMAQITGWGLLEENGKKPKQLQTVEVEIYDHDLNFDRDDDDSLDSDSSDSDSSDSNSSNSDSSEGADNEIYAGHESGGKDICDGDSGGPLTVEDGEGDRVLVGVAARSLCGNKTYPLGVYMKVTYYLPWIKDKMNLSVYD